MTLRPDPEEFRTLAQEYTVVPVWRELLADTVTPVAAFSRIVGDQPGFLFESVEHGERWSRYSFVGRRPSATLVSKSGHVQADGHIGEGIGLDQGILAVLESVLSRYRSPHFDDLPPLHGGVVGYLGYDVVREVERLGSGPTDSQGHPDAVLWMIGQLAAFDHWRQRVYLIENVVIDARWGPADLDAIRVAAGSRLDEMARQLAEPVTEPLAEPPRPGEVAEDVRRVVSPQEFRSAVEEAKERIRAGDIFQVVLSQRFDLELGADPFDVYRVLRQVNPSPYMYFLRHPEVTLVGSSPEPMVQLLDGRVISRPIAGTRRRGETDAEDRRLAGELSEHPKERAEHTMLVDLARNDVGRVVEFGTEVVDEFMTLERYSHVMHLTSQVSGTLAAGLGPIDVLRATLPAGTVSGAPKVMAMTIIDELESTRRGVYAGIVGYVDFSSNLDTAIAIRTMVVTPNGWASVQAGAGIVADSDAEAEDRECAHKAAALLAAVPAARRMGRARIRVVPEQLIGSPFRSGAAGVWLEKDFISVRGPAAAEFLQGQLSQDVGSLAEGQAVDSFLLSPQGKVDAYLRASRLAEDEFVLDVAKGFGAGVVERLVRFRLRTQVEIALLEGWGCLAVRGPDAGSWVPALAPQLVVPTDWPGLVGIDALGDGIQVPAGLSMVTVQAWGLARLEAGLPLLGMDIQAGAIPAETGLLDRAVSFTKGCYTGQELVARMDSRGNRVPRRLCRVIVGTGSDGMVLEPGMVWIAGSPDDPASMSVRSGESEVGRVTGLAAPAWRSDVVGLAQVTRAASVPGPALIVAGDAGMERTWPARLFPLTPDG